MDTFRRFPPCRQAAANEAVKIELCLRHSGAKEAKYIEGFRKKSPKLDRMMGHPFDLVLEIKQRFERWDKLIARDTSKMSPVQIALRDRDLDFCEAYLDYIFLTPMRKSTGLCDEWRQVYRPKRDRT